MKKTFGSAFALIMVALFTVAPTSPATAAGGIHLHMAGKVGQKAVGTTIIFGAESVSDVDTQPNGCLNLTTAINAGDPPNYPVRPIPAGWDNYCKFSNPAALAVHVPAGGNFAGSEALPALPAGVYQLWWGVYQRTAYGGGELMGPLAWRFTIGDDGTFTAIRALPPCELQMPPICPQGAFE